MNISKESINAYLGGSLVYLPILKNANSFFTANLVENFGWVKIDFKNIDWARHRVFGHIQDPIVRRHKGIAEYLELTNTTDLLENTRFQEFIRHVPALDEHSTSIFEKLGPYCWLVDWIPLDYGHEETIRLTEILIRFSGIRIFHNKWNMDYVHRSHERKQTIAEKLKLLWQERPPRVTMNKYFDQDMSLYQQVLEKFDRFGDSWDHISWLRDRYGYA